MNSGRLLVNGEDFYCGNGSNGLCQLARLNQVPSAYVHPTTKQCSGGDAETLNGKTAIQIISESASTVGFKNIFSFSNTYNITDSSVYNIEIMNSSLVNSKIFDSNAALIFSNGVLTSYCSGCYGHVSASLSMGQHEYDYDTNVFSLSASLISPETLSSKSTHILTDGVSCIKANGSSLSNWYASIRPNNNLVLQIYVTNSNNKYPVNSSVKIDINIYVLTV